MHFKIFSLSFVSIAILIIVGSCSQKTPVSTEIIDNFSLDRTSMFFPVNSQL